MKKLIVKVIIYVAIVVFCVATINYVVDPAYLFHSAIVDNMVIALSKGNTIESPGDVNEGLFKKKMIPELSFKPETVVIGSSHVMYIDWDRLYPNTLNTGVSGAYLGEYYAIIGLLKAYNINPKRIIIGVDAWAFTRNAEKLRHKELNEFAFYAKDLVKGKKLASIEDYNNVANSRYQNIKEMFSFSYFQSSFRKLMSNGLTYYLQNDSEKIRICDNDEPIKSSDKITANMQLVMSLDSYKSLEENEAGASEQILSKSIFQIGSSYTKVDNQNFQEFIDLVDYIMQEGIEIEFYLPTYYPSMYKMFESDEDYHGIIEVEERIRKLGAEKGIVVHGTYNPEEAGIINTDFADFLHMTPDVMLENYELVIE